MAQSPPPSNPGSQFDAAVKEIFQSEQPSLLWQLTGGFAPVEFLNVEMQLIQERSVDLLIRTESGSLVHIEFQSHNHPQMEYRAAEYHLWASWKFKQPVDCIVLYIGSARLSMRDRLDTGLLQFQYRLIDIRDISTDDLLRTGKLSDAILAFLTMDDPANDPRTKQILARLPHLPPSERGRAAVTLITLGALREAERWLYNQFMSTSILFDVEKNSALQLIIKGAVAREVPIAAAEMATEMATGMATEMATGMATKIATGMATEMANKATQSLVTELIEARFGPLPPSAVETVSHADPAELHRLALRFVHAKSLEEIFN